MTNGERILKLEERLTWLQRHLVEQDKVMMEMGDTIARLKRELLSLRERADGSLPGNTMPADDKPPHY